MSFADKLRLLRKERGLSQEEFAELIGVSRQAVGKWENDMAFPEVETLIEISRKLNVSLDMLFSDETGYEPTYAKAEKRERPVEFIGKIRITTHDEMATVLCVDVKASQEFRSKSGTEPKFALYGITGYSPFWGQGATLLGWYEDEESIKKEIDAIHSAFENGEEFYKLRYAVKIKKKWGRYLIDK